MIWLILGVVASVLIYRVVIKPHRYWTEKGVLQKTQMPILGDSYTMTLQLRSFADNVVDIYNQFPNARYSGTYQFTLPILIIKDLELLKQLTVKEFEHFTDHQQLFPEGVEPLWSKNLFGLPGAKWKDMRATLSPSFTSSKIKMMYTLMSKCAEDFTSKIVKDANGSEMDMKDICRRFANDVIATTAFGISVDSYGNKDNEFYNMGSEISNFSGFWRMLTFILLTLFPKLSHTFGIRMFSERASRFFKELVSSTIKYREEQGIIRPDMIHLLNEARKGRVKEDDHIDAETGFATVEESEIGKAKVQKKMELTDEDICAQALIFFLAGFDSVSTEMSFMAYELAVNTDVQDKLRNEIDETLKECNGKLTYEALVKMKYMDMVVSETLRLWPNAVATDRVCTKPFTIEAATSEEVPVHMSLKSSIWVPIYAIHRDPQYYPDPDRFDPERFNDENRGSIKPYTYLPFGVGPRNCIGSRFALVEIKVLFFHLLSKLEIEPVAKTPIPMRLCKTGFNLTADPGFYLSLKPRK